MPIHHRLTQFRLHHPPHHHWAPEREELHHPQSWCVSSLAFWSNGGKVDGASSRGSRIHQNETQRCSRASAGSYFVRFYSELQSLRRGGQEEGGHRRTCVLLCADTAPLLTFRQYHRGCGTWRVVPFYILSILKTLAILGNSTLVLKGRHSM